MRARAIAGGIVTSAAVLAVGWQIGVSQVVATQATAPGASSSSGSSSSTGSGSSTGSSGTSSSGSSATASPSATPSSGSSSGSGSVSGTFQGDTEQTQFGPVQVAIVVKNGTITDVTALQLTNDGGRSVAISKQAAPILRTEALSAQSASIQSVSGATYTSEGYITSLQSAIDRAGL